MAITARERGLTNPYCCNFYFTTVGIFFMRDVESDAFICGKISRWGRWNNRLHTLLTETILPLRLLRSRLIELFLLCRGSDSRRSREGEEGDEKE